MSRLYREITGIWSKRGRLTLITGVVMIMLVLQACGNNTGSGSNSAAGSGGTNTAEAAGGKAASNVPAVLNFGYIGSNKLNLPGGAEGWGLYKGIIQEEPETIRNYRNQADRLPERAGSDGILNQRKTRFRQPRGYPGDYRLRLRSQDPADRPDFSAYSRLSDRQEGRAEDGAGPEGQDDCHPKRFVYAPLCSRLAEAGGRN